MVTLCDLDAAAPIGQVRGKDLKCSTAYCPPEHVKALVSGTCVQTLASFDVWSLGVMLFEMMTGRHLWAQDISDDSMVNSDDLSKLCLWLVAPDNLLDLVLPDHQADAGGDCAVDSLRTNACHLVRWCLQSNEALRPCVDAILSHPLLEGSCASAEHDVWMDRPGREGEELRRSGREVSWEAIDDGLVEMSHARMRFHFFISHVQAEASGDVGTLYFLMSQLGIHCWRDMNTSELTESAMKQGALCLCAARASASASLGCTASQSVLRRHAFIAKTMTHPDHI